MESLTKINEDIKYRPVVAAIESTIFLKSASVKTSVKVRPFFSFARPAIPLYAMNMAANWRTRFRTVGSSLFKGFSHRHINR